MNLGQADMLRSGEQPRSQVPVISFLLIQSGPMGSKWERPQEGSLSPGFESRSAFQPFTSALPLASCFPSDMRGHLLCRQALSSWETVTFKGVVLLGQSWARLCTGLSTVYLCFPSVVFKRVEEAHTQGGGVWNFPSTYPEITVEVPLNSPDDPAPPRPALSVSMPYHVCFDASGQWVADLICNHSSPSGAPPSVSHLGAMLLLE